MVKNDIKMPDECQWSKEFQKEVLCIKKKIKNVSKQKIGIPNCKKCTIYINKNKEKIILW